MNKTSIIIESVLGAAVVTLFVLFFVFMPKKSVNQVNAAPAEGSFSSFAYVELDSIMANYQFAKDASDKLQTQYEDAQLELKKKQSVLEGKIATQQQDEQKFAEKYQSNSFLSADRAQSEYDRLQTSAAKLQKEYEALQQLAAQKASEFETEMAKLNTQLRDSLDNYLQVYNETAGFEAIFVGAIVLTATEGHDITNQILDGLNARYQAQ